MTLWASIASQNDVRVECSVSRARGSVGLVMCRKMRLGLSGESLIWSPDTVGTEIVVLR